MSAILKQKELAEYDFTPDYGKFKPVSKSTIQFCCITMNMADRLRLLACPGEVVPLIREAVLKTWEGGIHVERGYNGSHEFKLRGNPWHAHGETSVQSRKLLAAILTAMATFGWNLIQSTDVSKREGDKDSLFFEKGLADPDARLFVVAFHMSNRIRLIDAPDLFPCILEAVKQYWTKGIVEETEFNGSIELKMKGNPWYPVGEDAVQSKLVLCKVLANMRNLGFKLYASVDLSYGTEGQDLETWIFRRIWHDLEYIPTPCESCGKTAHKADCEVRQKMEDEGKDIDEKEEPAEDQPDQDEDEENVGEDD